MTDKQLNEHYNAYISHSIVPSKPLFQTRAYTQMQNPAPLKFLIQPNVSDEEIHICYDYYCPPIGQHKNLLEHLIWICEKHQITPTDLANTLKKFRAYDTTTACQRCHILKQVTEPKLTLINIHTTSAIKEADYICEYCYEFIASSF